MKNENSFLDSICWAILGFNLLCFLPVLMAGNKYIEMSLGTTYLDLYLGVFLISIPSALISVGISYLIGNLKIRRVSV